MTSSCACAILAVAFVVPTTFAQQEQILDELQALKARVAERAKVETWRQQFTPAQEGQIADQINALLADVP